MVLQDVGNSAPESFSDNPYPPSNDPYASPSSLSGAARFDPSTLPQPLPILGTFMGFSDRAVRFKAETTLKFAERKLGRQLYAEESQALAYHIYQLEQTKSYFAATGAAAGTYRWYTTWEKIRYPFYQPKLEDIDRNKFGPIKGTMAQLARHTWRFSLYVLVAGQMGNILGQLIAQPLAAVNTSKDPKLEQFGIELKAASHAEGQRTAQTGRDIEAKRREFEEQVKNRSGGGPSPQASWGRQPIMKAEESGDNMSPTAGNEAWPSSTSRTQSWERFSNDTSHPTSPRQHNSSSMETEDRKPSSRQPHQSSSLPFDDDASPTGGLFQDEVNNAQSQSQSRSGESSWDRLRRGGAPSPQRLPQNRLRRADPELKEQREGSTLGDSYTIVEGDEERLRERQRAQQEFDDRLERERQGRDFTGDESRRW